jgi:flagellar biosynthetic protein FliQ
MTPELVAGIVYEAIKTAIMVSAPMLLIGLIVGLLVSIFQSATQINEMTLVFIPKMLAVGVAALLFFPWMLTTLVEYTQGLITNVASLIP